EQYIADKPVKIASAIGRYYAMDRDNRWERVKKAYDVLVNGEGKATQSITEAIKASYAEGITDEFVDPVVSVNNDGSPVAVIKEDDVVICFNFRTDWGREISQALTQRAYPREILVSHDGSRVNIRGDRITSIQGFYAAAELKLELTIESGSRTKENPWGVYIIKEREE
ncbi:MAG: hypothetical protein EOP06_24020, partial [Proteobacteria bacterium]